MSETLLDVRDITKTYGDTLIIASASFSLKAGEVLCLTGSSGIGKSTLLEIAAGVLHPDSGTVTREGRAALMFQDDVLVPWLNAEESIMYILPSSMHKAARTTLANRWLSRFGLKGGQRPANMSGGMRRRLSLAVTFAATRPLVLLDEPFAFLDADNQRIVAEEIAAHTAAGGGVILTTHATEPLALACLKQTSLRTISITETPIVIAEKTPGQ